MQGAQMQVPPQSQFHVSTFRRLANRTDAQIYALVAAVAVLVGLIYQFGYAFVISLALLGTASALTFLIYLTASDVFAKRPAKAGTEPATPVARRVRRADRSASGAQ
jgi:cyanate permease